MKRRAMVKTDENGYQVMQWYWKICTHEANHGGCKQLDDGLCAVKALRYEYWNGDRWVDEPMLNHATPEQEKVLDNK